MMSRSILDNILRHQALQSFDQSKLMIHYDDVNPSRVYDA
jgi:hypothetical protein